MLTLEATFRLYTPWCVDHIFCIDVYTGVSFISTIHAELNTVVFQCIYSIAHLCSENTGLSHCIVGVAL
jgi:hypothetical protein